MIELCDFDDGATSFRIVVVGGVIELGTVNVSNNCIMLVANFLESIKEKFQAVVQVRSSCQIDRGCGFEEELLGGGVLVEVGFGAGKEESHNDFDGVFVEGEEVLLTCMLQGCLESILEGFGVDFAGAEHFHTLVGAMGKASVLWKGSAINSALEGCFMGCLLHCSGSGGIEAEVVDVLGRSFFGGRFFGHGAYLEDKERHKKHGLG